MRNKAQMVLFFTVVSLLVSCQSNPEKKMEDQPVKSGTINYTKPGSSFNDTIIVNGKAIVFFEADTMQLEKIRKLLPANLFETSVHTCFYLRRNAKKVIQQSRNNVPVKEINRSRYLLFIKNSHEKVCIDLNSVGDMCGCYLFDGNKNPEYADLMNIETTLHNYFD